MLLRIVGILNYFFEIILLMTRNISDKPTYRIHDWNQYISLSRKYYITVKQNIYFQVDTYTKS